MAETNSAPATPASATVTETPTMAEGGGAPQATGGTPATPAEKRVPVVIDGKTEHLTKAQILKRLESIPEEELANWESLNRASQQRFQSAAEIAKQTKQDKAAIAAFKNALASGDAIKAEKAFEVLGLNGRQIAEKILWRHYEREKATPEERRKMELDEREKNINETERQRKEREQAETYQQEVESLYDELSGEISECFSQAGVDLDDEAHAELVPRVAYHMDAVHKATGHLPSVHEVVDFIRTQDAKRSEKAEKKLLAALAKGDLSKLPQDVQVALRNAFIQKATGGDRPEPNTAAPQKNTGKPKDTGWKPKVYRDDDVESFKKTMG